MATYCRGHPKSTWWDTPPQAPELGQVLSGPVAFAILDEALREGNRDVVNLIKKPTETEMLKQFNSTADAEKKSTGPRLTDGGLSVPGVPGGMVVPVDNEDPLQAMRQWVRKQVSRNTGMRPQDINFSGEKAQVPKKKAPIKKRPISAPSLEPVPQAPKPVPQLEAPKPKKDQPRACLMFPGQGSQYVKMLSELKDNAVVKGYCETAQKILGYDILDLCLFGPEKDLEETSRAQPALFLAGMAGLEKLKGINPEAVENPGCVAGLSLGEYTALCAAGVFTFEQGLTLVKIRAEAMSEAAKSLGPGGQLMLSVAGLEEEVLQQICKDHTHGDELAVIANVLFPKGFACSGTKASIEKMQDACVKAGAMQAKVLKTSGAFHSSFMKPAQVKLEEAIKALLPDMKPPRCDVYVNYTGKRIKAGTSPDELAPLLANQLTNPVLWDPLIRNTIKDGMNQYYEIGPMKQLKAMMKRIDPKMWEKTNNVDV